MRVSGRRVLPTELIACRARRWLLYILFATNIHLDIRPADSCSFKNQEMPADLHIQQWVIMLQRARHYSFAVSFPALSSNAAPRAFIASTSSLGHSALRCAS